MKNEEKIKNELENVYLKEREQIKKDYKTEIKKVINIFENFRDNYNILELRYFNHGHSVFRTVLRYCNSYGLDRFLENENIIDYASLNSYSNKIIIHKEISELPENYWCWISDNLERLRFNAINYSSARDNFLNCFSFCFMYDCTDNIEDVLNKMEDFIQEMENNINEIENNPMVTLQMKLGEIDDKLYYDKKEIDFTKPLANIQEELNDLSREIDKKLYQDMVNLFPEIKVYKKNDIEILKKEKERFYRYTSLACDVIY